MKTMKDFILNKKGKLILFLLGLILVLAVFVVGVGFHKNKNQSLGNIGEESKKAESLTEVPDGYTPITTPEELANIANDLSGNYILMNSIDMSGVEFSILGQTGQDTFTGVFDGNAYTIENLIVESDNQYVGLFGVINGGTVKNLTLQNINVKGTSSGSIINIGCLAGYVSNSTTIQNVNVVGNSIVTDTENAYNSYIGGLVGYLTKSTVKQCSSSGNVSTMARNSTNVGGLIGRANGEVTIEKCSSSSEVINNSQSSSDLYIGGLIGGASAAGTIQNCSSDAKVVNNSQSTSNYYMGGLIGATLPITINNSSGGTITTSVLISDSSSSGTLINNAETVVDNSFIGGLIGNMQYGGLNNSHSTTTIQAKSGMNIGGLIGARIVGPVSQCYSDSTIIIQGTLKGNIGGLIGSQTKGILSECYSNTDINIDIANIDNNYIGGLIGKISNTSNIETRNRKIIC